MIPIPPSKITRPGPKSIQCGLMPFELFVLFCLLVLVRCSPRQDRPTDRRTGLGGYGMG